MSNTDKAQEQWAITRLAGTTCKSMEQVVVHCGEAAVGVSKLASTLANGMNLISVRGVAFALTEIQKNSSAKAEEVKEAVKEAKSLEKILQ